MITNRRTKTEVLSLAVEDFFTGALADWCTGALCLPVVGEFHGYAEVFLFQKGHN
jgi:hypothetical protein